MGPSKGIIEGKTTLNLYFAPDERPGLPAKLRTTDWIMTRYLGSPILEEFRPGVRRMRAVVLVQVDPDWRQSGNFTGSVVADLPSSMPSTQSATLLLSWKVAGDFMFEPSSIHFGIMNTGAEKSSKPIRITHRHARPFRLSHIASQSSQIDMCRVMLEPKFGATEVTEMTFRLTLLIPKSEQRSLLSGKQIVRLEGTGFEEAIAIPWVALVRKSKLP